MGDDLIKRSTDNNLEQSQERRELKKQMITQTQLSIDFYNSDVLQTVEMAKYTKIPITEISALGAAFSELIPMITNIGYGNELYRVSLSKGGELVHVKGSIGEYRGFAMGKNGIQEQAKLKKAGTLESGLPTLFMAVAIMGLQHEIKELQKMHTELIEIVERDKHSQLTTDMELLNEYANDYKYYWENDSTVTVNLNQVKNIKRNARKDLISYGKEVNEILDGKMDTLFNYGAAKKVNKLSDRFAHFRLALYVYAFAEYMEVMLSQNFNEEYLKKTRDVLKNFYDEYRVTYTKCYNEIDHTAKTALGTQVVDGIATASRFIGEQIGKVKRINETKLDDLIIANSDVIKEKEAERLQEIQKKFITYKDSGLDAFVDKINRINTLYNEQFELLMDNEYLYINTAIA